MAEIYVGTLNELRDNYRKIVRDGKLEIGVFYREGRLYAYRNLCIHQGGPACEGLIMHKVEDVIADDKTYRGQRFSDDEVHFVCPWHGYEYVLADGRCAPDRSRGLKKYEVVARDGDVYVIT
jgi:nitrite reductase/ring-hydroxylating ferredoxin subunit